MHSADVHATTSPCRSDSGLRFGPHFLLKTPRLFRAFLDLSGFGFLRLACGTAVKSVRISISVSLPVRVRDEPVECLPWTRRTGVSQCFPCFGNVRAHSGRRWPRPRALKLVSFLEFQVGSCRMPIRDHSGQSSQPYWHGVRGRSGRSLFKVHWNLSYSQVHTQRLHSNEVGP